MPCPESACPAGRFVAACVCGWGGGTWGSGQPYCRGHGALKVPHALVPEEAAQGGFGTTDPPPPPWSGAVRERDQGPDLTPSRALPGRPPCSASGGHAGRTPGAGPVGAQYSHDAPPPPKAQIPESGPSRCAEGLHSLCPCPGHRAPPALRPCLRVCVCGGIPY